MDIFDLDAEDLNVLYSRQGVIVIDRKSSEGDEWLLSGKLDVVTTKFGTFIRWKQDDEIDHAIQVTPTGSGPPSNATGDTGVFGSLPDREWAVVNGNNAESVRYNPRQNGADTSMSAVTLPSSLERRQVRPISVDVTDLKSYRLSDDSNQVTLIQKDGTKNPALIFLDEGPHGFLDVIHKFLKVRQSRSDERLYLLTDIRLDALDQSLSQLNLFDKSSTDAVWKFVSDLHKDPYTTTLNTFSKLTDKLIFSPSEDDSYRPDEDMAELLHRSLHVGPNLDVTTDDDGGEFEVVTPRPHLMKDLPKVERSDPLCQLDWELHLNEDGKVLDVEELKRKVFKGGVDHNIRAEVWKFLLGYYKYDTTFEERTLLRKAKVDSYFRMKLQWKSVSEEQEDRFSAFRERKTQIEKDISRTDRTHPFFQGDSNKNVVLLRDILMTYVMFNFDLGYVQGMSDILSPILYVMQNEVDAFWCFVGFMEKMSSNFEIDQGGMKAQLSQLIDLEKAVDPELYSYLDAKDSGNMYFCFRWLLIWFKREFNYADVMRLWEVLWTGLPCQNFHLLFCAALLDNEKTSIVENHFGFTEILKHINDMSHNINLSATLCKAEAIYTQMSKSSSHVSNAGRRVVGLNPITEQDLVEAEEAKGSNGHAVSKPMAIKQTGGKMRHRSNCSNDDNSSSVEVISELDDEGKFANSLMKDSPFE